MDLELEFGAVRADIDLGGLSLTTLSVETGASESLLDVSLPNPIAMTQASSGRGPRPSPPAAWATSTLGESR